mmetsp:Transcript_113799/g.321833  ORF Transcript_113799/g.321833 Transcript_113799/m.321833 type:complete len:293 (-) Transcript_113799:63-941(-)
MRRRAVARRLGAWRRSFGLRRCRVPLHQREQRRSRCSVFGRLASAPSARVRERGAPRATRRSPPEARRAPGREAMLLRRARVRTRERRVRWQGAWLWPRGDHRVLGHLHNGLAVFTPSFARAMVPTRAAGRWHCAKFVASRGGSWRSSHRGGHLHNGFEFFTPFFARARVPARAAGRWHCTKFVASRGESWRSSHHGGPFVCRRRAPSLEANAPRSGIAHRVARAGYLASAATCGWSSRRRRRLPRRPAPRLGVASDHAPKGVELTSAGGADPPSPRGLQRSRRPSRSSATP